MTLAQPSLPFTVAVFAGVIGILVFVHEFGHYYVARLCGVRADTFAIGFGREVAGWTDKRGTRWRLGWLPFGGYVRFAGDANEASQPAKGIEDTPLSEREGLFHFAPLWQKSLITVAGPLTNFLFALLIYIGFFIAVGAPMTPAKVGRVDPAGAAAATGIVAGDRILAIDGARIERFDELTARVGISVGDPLLLRIERGGSIRTIEVRPRIISDTDGFGNVTRVGRLGIFSGPSRWERLGPLEAIPAAGEHVVTVVRSQVVGLWQIITGRRSIKEMGGPVKMAQISGQVASVGWVNLVELVALISINLGFINLLPIPMLDGGHLFLYALQAVRRRPLGARIQEWAFLSGFAALVSLMVLLTWNDLGSIGVWKHLTGLLG